MPSRYSQGLSEMNHLRGERHKVYLIDNRVRRSIFKTVPIHFYDGRQWIDTDLTMHPRQTDKGVQNYLTEQNGVTIGARRDTTIDKAVGMRPYGRSDVQMEWTPLSLVVNGREELPPQFSNITAKRNKTYQHFREATYLVQEVTPTSLISAYQLPSVHELELIERIDLKGLHVSNAFKDGEYLPDEHGRFLFCDDTGVLRFWLKEPWVIRNEDREPPWKDVPVGEREPSLSARLIVNHGELWYVKQGLFNGRSMLVDSTTYYSTTNDGYVYTDGGGPWSTLRNASTGKLVGDSYTDNAEGMMARYADYYRLRREFLFFNTASLPDGETVTEAILRVCGQGRANSAVTVQPGTQATTLTTADLDAFTGAARASVDPWTINAWNEFTLDATGQSEVNLTGVTKYCLREKAHDYGGVDPYPNSYRNGLYSGDDLTYPPELVVTHSGEGVHATYKMMLGVGI